MERLAVASQLRQLEQEYEGRLAEAASECETWRSESARLSQSLQRERGKVRALESQLTQEKEVRSVAGTGMKLLTRGSSEGPHPTVPGAET